MPLSVFATIRPRPEHLPDAIAAIEGVVNDTRVEAGCIQFDLYEQYKARLAAPVQLTFMRPVERASGGELG